MKYEVAKMFAPIVITQAKIQIFEQPIEGIYTWESPWLILPQFHTFLSNQGTYLN